MYSVFGHETTIIRIGSEKFPEWISQSSQDGTRMSLNVSHDSWEEEFSDSSELSENGSTLCLKLPPNMSYDYMGMILCFKCPKDGYCFDLDYSVKTSSYNYMRSYTDVHVDGSCCTSSLLAQTLTKRLFQIYFGFGHLIKIYPQVFPDWISQSENSREMSLRMPPNESHNLLGMILCFEGRENYWGYNKIDYSVENTTTGFIWRELSYLNDCESLMVILPISIFPITDADEKIVLTSSYAASVCGIYLLYKSEDDNTVKSNSSVGYSEKPDGPESFVAHLEIQIKGPKSPEEMLIVWQRVLEESSPVPVIGAQERIKIRLRGEINVFGEF
ncbi:hypothetical protein POM88_020021 [Heracleum sosnowskyi]|uniref:Uncharacterized protein n=1 Tax=Heracleum sosnowskyi TaxID=360622 RepID=A0AAD8IC13_9APIA|nr:hypothetical protein POM88_020021 [Heracleum sosnowskyi]